VFFYKCLPKKTYQLGDYVIEAVQPQHIEKIRKWRNEQMDVLRQSKPISKAEQFAYYEKNVWPEMIKKNPDKILLSIMHDGILKGYGGLVYLNWEHLRGEISFILDTQIANTEMDFGELFPLFLLMIKNIAFHDLSLYRIYGELFDIRPQYAKAFENAGFTLEGVLKAHRRLNGEPIDSLIYGISNAK
tara:strand:+ start:267 stop:830 length:564 start_codon:yes stop_codon:yes gene_type:complete